MIRLRRQYNLSMLMTVTFVLAINFAWMPWPAVGVLTVAIIIPLLFSGLKLIDWLVIYGIVVVFGIMLWPAHTPNPWRRRARKAITAPVPGSANRGAPNGSPVSSTGPQGRAG
jgi:hypothetical protein